MKLLYVLGLVSISANFSYGQELSCDQKLIQAETDMEEGHFYSIPTTLTTCLNDKSYSTDQSIRAYSLLVQSNLVLGNQNEAEVNYLKLLKIDPEFIPTIKDNSIDLVYFSKKFTTNPIFVPNYRFGINSAFYRQLYSVSVDPYPVSEKRNGLIGLQVGAGIDWNFYRRLALCAEANFSIRGYKMNRGQIAGNDIQSVTSNLNWFDFPVFLKYSKINGRLRPYGYAGYAFSYLISAKNSFAYYDKKAGIADSFVDGPSEDLTFQRSRPNHSWLVGAGIKYKIGRNFFYVDIRYMGAMSNLANKMIYYSNSNNINSSGNPNYVLNTNITKYRYVSDYFKLDNLSLSIGYSRPIYAPRKVKKAMTRRISKEVRNSNEK